MSDQITPIPKIRAAAEKSLKEGKSIEQRPAEFLFMEDAWRREFKLAQHALRAEVVA